MKARGHYFSSSKISYIFKEKADKNKTKNIIHVRKTSCNGTHYRNVGAVILSALWNRKTALYFKGFFQQKQCLGIFRKIFIFTQSTSNNFLYFMYF